MRSSLSVWFAAVLVVLVCGGCGSDGSSRSGATSAPAGSTAPAPEDSATTPASEVSDDASEQADADNVVSYAWTDTDGYSFSVEASDLAVSTETNTVDQKPGEGLVAMTISGQVSYTNTTPGRNASPEWFDVRPAWPLDSVFCKDSHVFGQVFRGYDADVFGGNMKFTPTPYCWGPTVRASLDGDGTLTEDETRAVTLDDSQSFQTIVPESELETATSQAQAPSFWAIIRGTGGPQTERGTGICSTGGEGLGTSPIVVATSGAGASVCQQDVQ